MEVNTNHYHNFSAYDIDLKIYSENCDYESTENELIKIVNYYLQSIKKESELTKKLMDDVMVMKNPQSNLSDKIVSCLKVADCFRYGWGVSKNEEIAFRCSKWSANRNAVGKYYLAECYSEGVGVMRNDGVAFIYYILSAESGFHKAQYQLGLHYQYGKGVPKNLSLAYHNYELAAKQKNIGAFEKLAEFYEEGIYVMQNTEIANKCKRNADALRRDFFDEHVPAFLQNQI